MSRLLRHYSPGKIYFVTAVTHNRKPILVDMFAAFWHSVEIAQARQVSDLVAWVVMPDHVHMIIDEIYNESGDLVLSTTKLDGNVTDKPRDKIVEESSVAQNSLRQKLLEARERFSPYLAFNER